LGEKAVSASAFLDFAQGQVDPNVLESVSKLVREVERELEHQVGNRIALVASVGKQTLQAGGKRLRPAFVGLAAQATMLPFDPRLCIRFGACMEMIHMATLIHDDVIDHADTRRGLPTASAIYGATAAVLSGDVLLAKAMSILAEEGHLDVIRTVSAAVVDMAEGEVRELETRNKFDLTEQEHMEVLHLKTASFIECCCDIGATLCGANDDVRQGLRAYGYHVGIAFQIADDLLDYRGDPSITGKPVATDFREGCATLPLIYLRGLLSDEERKVAQLKFGNGVSDDELRMICGWMETRGAFAKAQATAEHHSEKALAALEPLPSSSTRDLLETVATLVVRRAR
jgi:octaprenyl-diphosphate synthase